MTQHGMIDKLSGVVEIDEVYIGPKERGTGLRGMHPESKARRGFPYGAERERQSRSLIPRRAPKAEQRQADHARTR